VRLTDDSYTNDRIALSKIKDLDYAEAITRMNVQMAGLQASQQAYARVQGLSLFNYL
jgi:flagellar hook-associated protein 3 FlgL